MPKQAMENLTESMFYLLMALQQGDACGAEISARAAQISGGAVRLGPATLYTLLARFEKEGLLTDAGTVGCKRYYRLTAAGKAAYEESAPACSAAWTMPPGPKSPPLPV